MVNAPKETMDRMLAYRNILCAEDHLDELILAATNLKELEELSNYKVALEGVRSKIGFAEEDERFHCLNKHLAVAYEAAREVAKETRSSEDKELASLLGSYSKWALEKLIGSHIEFCGRCKKELNGIGTKTATRGSDDDSSKHGDTGSTVPSNSQNRIVNLLDDKVAVPSGK